MLEGPEGFDGKKVRILRLTYSGSRPMSRSKTIDILQSASEAAGLAIACDCCDSDLQPTSATSGPPLPHRAAPDKAATSSRALAAVPADTARPAGSPRPDTKWAEPQFLSEFATPKAVVSTSLAYWIAARMPRFRAN